MLYLCSLSMDYKVSFGPRPTLLLLLMTSLLPLSMGQVPSPSTSLDSSSPNPTDFVPSDGAGSSSNDDDGEPNDNGVVNYYFLLLAIFVILVAVSYYFVARRRRSRLVLLRTNRQDALQRDLEGWQGNRYWGPGRWRTPASHDTRPEEGLDERGLPPPPYIPAAPKETHPGSSHHDEGAERAIPLQNLPHPDQKPPDYFERAVDSRDPAAAGPERPNGPSQP